MPIPTRSASLREPRKPSSIARPTSSGLKAPTRPTTATTPTDTSSSSTKESNVSNRGRTLLPQRSNTGRDDVSGAQPRFPPVESRLLPRGETSPRRQQQVSSEGQGQGQGQGQAPRQPSSKTAATTTTSATANTAATPAPTRRQSLMRPGTLKVSSTRSNVSAQLPSKASASTSASASTPTFRPPSPRKPPMRSPAQSSAPRPPSPKKTEMLPPPRPARSASLRQPANTGAPLSSATRGHARHRSQLVPPSTKPIQPEPSQKPRAGFSTYQQHYSPKKPTAKPPTPTPGDTSSSTGLLIPTSWPDIAALQTELLQLSLFHSSALERHAEWKSESESQLRKKYNAVASQYRSTLGDEKMRQRHMNVRALGQWAEICREHNGPHGLSDQVQSLSQILQEVSDLLSSEMGGKYAHAVRVFEDWFNEAEDIRHRRETSRVLDRVEFIDPLDQSWKEEVRSLQAKLDLCARRLEALDIVGLHESEKLERSAFTRVARGLTESLQLMTQELRAMRTAESEMIRSERETVSRMATQMTSFPLEKSTGRVGIWKT
ncbi:hypothetical protein N7456_002869 [Penicillium angulare]|uniref:Uncharacterized protein n=1 Tax=Penicillium angulare TaxID=116970 RepID=A0A9W9FTQ2_9EURO|nr:hypothetical protein N7456_002869 [Penicillium angulare]